MLDRGSKKKHDSDGYSQRRPHEASPVRLKCFKAHGYTSCHGVAAAHGVLSLAVSTTPNQIKLKSLDTFATSPRDAYVSKHTSIAWVRPHLRVARQRPYLVVL
jgi:hypothetical protein